LLNISKPLICIFKLVIYVLANFLIHFWFSDKIDVTFKVNVISHFWTIKSFLGEMIEREKGHIVTIAR
jgi:NAD(P)-dependent dehydrogenase (short-subunit alcohol dehydrogenase family)